MKTIKTLILTAISLCCLNLNAKAQYEVSQGKYAVKFTDKSQNNYTLDKPEEFLSKKALDRREKFSINFVEGKFIEKIFRVTCGKNFDGVFHSFG